MHELDEPVPLKVQLPLVEREIDPVGVSVLAKSRFETVNVHVVLAPITTVVGMQLTEVEVGAL